MMNQKTYILIFLLLWSVAGGAQIPGTMFHKVMEEQMQKSMGSLRIPGMPNPFYIGANIVDQNRIVVHSSLGSLLKASESRNRGTQNLQVLVGDYNNSNLNSNQPNESIYPFRARTNITAGDCFDETRRRLWLVFDRAYKMSVDLYSAKQSSNKNVTASEWTDVPDFMPGKAIQVDLPAIDLKFENDKLIKYTNAISASLKAYPQLTYSWVRLTGTKANIYYSNTEGTKASYPNSIVRLVVNAETLTADGEKLELYQTYHVGTEAELPPLELVLSDTKEIANTLLEIRNAPVFNDVYNGPVLFEGPAASEVVRKTMFYAGQENLYAKRERRTNAQQTSSGSNKISTELRINTRIASEALSVKACPKKSEFNGISLIGTYPVDMEGTVPPEELVLIENGILKNLLCGRIPTLKMKESNGHLRVPAYSGMPVIAPGVIDVDFKNAVTKEELKKQLLESAKADGLNYAIIVREMTSNLSELRRVYQVDVNTGKETLVRSAGFNTLVLNDLRKIIGASNQKRVLNTTSGEDTNHRIDYLSGCPATFITPDAFLFKDIEISKSTKPNLNKLPVVKNPLEM